MTNSEQDPGYDAWISNLMSGRQSAEDQAARAAFRAMQARRAAPAAQRQAPPAVTLITADRNVWGAETGEGDDALTRLTLLAGPGRWANCTEGR